MELHVRAVASSVSDAERVAIILTHGHADHAESAPRLAGELGCEVFGPPGAEGVTVTLDDADRVETDEGALITVATPGHTRRHVCLHWPRRSALFAGDLLLGRGDTTWVAEYRGCVADYLSSLERVRSLAPKVIYPAHGPPLTDPANALDRFERHRRDRIRQVQEARAEHPHADLDELLDVVYGDTVPASKRGAARRSLEAVIAHLDGDGAPGR